MFDYYTAWNDWLLGLKLPRGAFSRACVLRRPVGLLALFHSEAGGPEYSNCNIGKSAFGVRFEGLKDSDALISMTGIRGRDRVDLMSTHPGNTPSQICHGLSVRIG